ncbi:osmoprotectant NAGGN system M42 family peptidase [Desulfohalovibrio reitneri]|uniref:osmoprotectant NAGGN system M42 family peptidase n=1 Tax=Desulfohalovibrio reitneri TaxID=1307759 RepID=UPI000689ABC9|nr:osmoprotectant NAGGN system M42 family peptidase [Desulfohalovibrio reitneri]
MSDPQSGVAGISLQRPEIDMDYCLDLLLRLVQIPSPTGYTDNIVRFLCDELRQLSIPFELTRRGAIRADLAGRMSSPDRAVVAHLDTIGGMVTELKDNGRLKLAPVGAWSSRFAEGARVTVFCEKRPLRGTVLPNKASGHTYHHQIDTQPVDWDNVEVRLDEYVTCREDLEWMEIHVGDFVAFDAAPEVTPTGFINSRHLDDKAGVAILMAAAKHAVESGAELPVDCHLLFTLTEEVGSGASSVLHGDVAELVSIDNAPSGRDQNSKEFGVTLAMMDSSGPFDYHLTHKLLEICHQAGIPHQRDVFKYYRCDAAAAIEAGNDLRTALACFGVDASHGYERTHTDSLQSVAELVALYMQSEPVAIRDRHVMGPLAGFTNQPGPATEEP